MNKQSKRIKRLSACLALFFSWGNGAVYADFGPAPSAGARLIPKVATLTEVKGTVEKSEPVGTTAMSPYMPAEKNDELAIGSYIQTHKNSWVSIKWKERGIDTRVWDESLVRIAPLARTVFLDRGNVYLSKDKTVHDDYFIETKRLQARIHGTTVTVFSDPTRDTIVCDETHSYVEVYNKTDGSRIRLTPGVVLEVRGSLKPSVDPLKSNSGQQPDSKNIALQHLQFNTAKGELIFQDNGGAKTIAYAVNAKAILSDPIIFGNDSIPPMDSADLVRATLSKLPTDDFVSTALDSCQNLFNSGKPDKLVSKGLKIESVPTKVGYYIGPNLGSDKTISLPSMAYTDFHPLGVIKNHDWSHKNVATNKLQPVAHMLPALPYTENPATEENN